MTNGIASETNGIARGTNGYTCAENALVLCPFCGSGWLYETQRNGYFDETPVMFCNSCKAVVTWKQVEEEGANEKTRLFVREHWNTRVAVTDYDFTMAVHDGELWRRVKNHVRCPECGLNIESLIPLESACNRHAVKYCPNCGADVSPYGEVG